MKAFAEDKLKMIQTAKSVLAQIENIVGKEENAGNQHFLFSHNVFKRPLLQGRLQSGLCGKELNFYVKSFLTNKIQVMNNQILHWNDNITKALNIQKRLQRAVITWIRILTTIISHMSVCLKISPSYKKIPNHLILLNDKILPLFKLKEFTDDKSNVAKVIISVWLDRKHCGKRRKYQHFSFPHNVFEKLPLQGC